ILQQGSVDHSLSSGSDGTTADEVLVQPATEADGSDAEVLPADEAAAGGASGYLTPAPAPLQEAVAPEAEDAKPDAEGDSSATDAQTPTPFAAATEVPGEMAALVAGLTGWRAVSRTGSSGTSGRVDWASAEPLDSGALTRIRRWTANDRGTGTATRTAARIKTIRLDKGADDGN
ncbi:MAG TPA: hypothetical protein VIX81_02355, partial [Gammaproteobacteria bacterium]